VASLIRVVEFLIGSEVPVKVSCFPGFAIFCGEEALAAGATLAWSFFVKF
jgi:hypothetical protein